MFNVETFMFFFFILVENIPLKIIRLWKSYQLSCLLLKCIACIHTYLFCCLEIRPHCSWNLGQVYDVSKFLEDHPGGDEVLLSSTGTSL